MIRWLVLLAIALASIFTVKKYFFPNDEQQIQRRLGEIAQRLTKPKGESLLATANKVGEALDYFLPPVTVTLNNDILTERRVSEQDKESLKNSLTGFRFQYAWVDVSFENVFIEVRGSEAAVDATARLEFPSEKQGLVYDLYQITMVWTKSDRNWYISKIDVSKRNE